MSEMLKISKEGTTVISYASRKHKGDHSGILDWT